MYREIERVGGREGDREIKGWTERERRERKERERER